MRKKRWRPFLMMEKRVLESFEWRALSHVEKLLYLYVKMGYNGNNNGDIPFEYSEYTKEFSSRTIAKVLGGKKQKGTLIEKGWLERRVVGGYYHYRAFFRLTGQFDIIK